MHTPSTIKYAGKLVAFEGIDRAGKSSVIANLPRLLNDCEVAVTTCGELQSPISQFLKDTLPDLSPLLKTFLFAADRAWTYEKICLPALEDGGLVLWDRYVDSAIVYRAVELAEGQQIFDLSFVRDINSVFAVPDLTIFIDIDPSTSQERAKKVGQEEPYDVEFLSHVRYEYEREMKVKGYSRIDGRLSHETVAMQAADAIRSTFKEIFNGS